ncbi:MAG: hypothetical protein EBY32_03205 [Proteobacteria bacterium]|nr:hypothetical protein [Pseudomonadota bacterium]
MKIIILAIFGMACILVSAFLITSKFGDTNLPVTSADARNAEVSRLQSDVTDPSPHPLSPLKMERRKEEAKSVLKAPSTQTPAAFKASSLGARAESQINETYSPLADIPTLNRSRANSATSTGFPASPLKLPTLPPAGFSGSDSMELELELAPGVAVPAALLPTEEERPSPIVAEAQERIVDSFVQDLQNVLADPLSAPSDAKVNDTYLKSLNNANEQYRALYGDAAFNQKTMQATMEAIKSK